MKDLFEQDKGATPPDPSQSARAAARPILRKRFFTQVAAIEVPEGFAVALDGKTLMRWSSTFEADGADDAKAQEVIQGIYDAGLAKVAANFRS